MRIAGYGSDTGPLVVYFHGAPGAPEEVARFDALARRHGVRLAAIDRGGFAPELGPEAYRVALADGIASLADGASVHLVGFSLGAFVALTTAPRLGSQVASLDLVSAAAPLELGDFLPGMAGRPVFDMARRSPLGFRAMTRVQAALAAHAPAKLFGMLFATAAGGDRALAGEQGFRDEVGAVLRRALGPGRRGYRRDVSAYVRPWAETLAEVRAPAWLWHGRDDNWAPPAMAVALEHALPEVRRLEIAPGLSHYSCLFEAMPQVLARIGGGVSD